VTRGVAGSALILAGLVLALFAALAPETAGAGAAAVTATQASSTDGALLFRTKGCAACHSVSEKGIRAYVGGPPDLSAAARDFGARRPGLSAEAYIAESIREPRAFLAPGDPGGFEMPVLGLNDAEIGAIARFLLGR
jgi:mono/diheme cytochrome c family protein